MKVGIFIKGHEHLANWELRVIEEIMNSSSLSLSLVIITRSEKMNLASKVYFALSGMLSDKNPLGTLALRLQGLVERKIFFKEICTVGRDKIFRFLDKISTLSISLKKRSLNPQIDIHLLNKIKAFDLDVLVNMGGIQFNGEIAGLTRHGIWSMHYYDNLLSRTGPIGFWEIMLDEPSVGVTLQQQTIDARNNIILDKAHFNRHWSYVKTQSLILEASVTLLLKNLGNLSQKKSLPDSAICSIPLYKSPSLFFSVKYIFRFYFCLLNKIVEPWFSYLFGIRYECWTIFIGKGNFLNVRLSELNPIELLKSEFWADPFLFEHEDNCYVFFENYSYKTKRGKISCGIISDDKIINVMDVLDMKYHLSYPFIFKEDDEIFLIPETCENKRLEIYRCIDFPLEWELYSTAFEGELVADATIYTDSQDQKWLFVNKQVVSTTAMENELYIYKIDSLKLERIQPHSQNPVIIDCRTARNAGPLFEHADKLYRPSQRNIDGIYGRALNINKIEKLTLDEYEEKTETIFQPNFRKGLSAMHHLHQLNGTFVFDAAYKNI